MKNIVGPAFLLCMLCFSEFAVASADTNSVVSGITAPVNKIYDLMKALISVLGMIAITVAGAMYMFSGSNISARENAKSMVSYAVVGLVLVWIAPLVVNYLTAPAGP